MAKQIDDTAREEDIHDAEQGGDAVQGNHEADGDVNDDNSRLVSVGDILTVGTLNCKPKPKMDADGKPETVKVGDKYMVVYPDQDLYALGGRATGYCFVQTDMGTSLQLTGEFEAQSLTPDHNGEVDILTRGIAAILPGKAEKVLVSQIEALGLPIGMTGEIEANGETGVSRTKVQTFKEPILLALIVGAKTAPRSVTGYEYVVKFVEKAKMETAPAALMLGSALKKRKVMLLAAPDSKHAS